MDWNGGYLSILSFLSFYLLTQNTPISSRYLFCLLVSYHPEFCPRSLCITSNPLRFGFAYDLMLPGQNGIASGWSSISIALSGSEETIGFYVCAMT
ncbi:hypothetical protein BDP81DRAFT_124642 [Colletotrichum phormii]|uniref:Secreted protein n=1 Tax=Colletotrichum phormii TaxID=359342 RepID=A0AAI9ZZ68_9PEZI|nr:uncharacterized protein BDP81DRAFT_124642 [Colletotrichum phormii]KAK1640921.1 hypothetical protein BDP81DRAFT_124642 [Colletotrichum phormii]